MRTKERAFTLGEVIIVMVIIGILMSVAIPSIKKYAVKQEEEVFKQQGILLEQAFEMAIDKCKIILFVAPGVYITYPIRSVEDGSTVVEDSFTQEQFKNFIDLVYSYWQPGQEVSNLSFSYQPVIDFTNSKGLSTLNVGDSNWQIAITFIIENNFKGGDKASVESFTLIDPVHNYEITRYL